MAQIERKILDICASVNQATKVNKCLRKRPIIYNLKRLSIGKFNYVDLLIEGSMMKYEIRRRQKLQFRRTENIED